MLRRRKKKSFVNVSLLILYLIFSEEIKQLNEKKSTQYFLNKTFAVNFIIQFIDIIFSGDYYAILKNSLFSRVAVIIS